VAKPTGMGRGLAAILSVSPETAAGEERAELRQIAVETIAPNPHQPRKRFDDEALAALAASLEANGVIQPILVRPLPGGTYELVAGERRWRAAQLAGLETVPALVQAHTDAQSIELALVENMAREDLNPVEEARAVAALVEELELTREEVGRRCGRSRVAVSNLLRLLDLPDEALALLEDGSLTEGHGRALLLAEDHADRRRLARSAAADGWSVRVTEAKAREANGAPASAGGPGTGGRPSASAGGLHPDQEAAVEEIAATLGPALGSDVTVRSTPRGYRVELLLESPDDARALAARLGARAGA
jgi:ParB family transcriptional regulator, chromosome partitioning protein